MPNVKMIRRIGPHRHAHLARFSQSSFAIPSEKLLELHSAPATRRSAIDASVCVAPCCTSGIDISLSSCQRDGEVRNDECNPNEEGLRTIENDWLRWEEASTYGFRSNTFAAGWAGQASEGRTFGLSSGRLFCNNTVCTLLGQHRSKRSSWSDVSAIFKWP